MSRVTGLALEHRHNIVSNSVYSSRLLSLSKIDRMNKTRILLI